MTDEVEVEQPANLPDVVVPERQSLTLFRTDEPTEIVRRATEVADTLARVLREKKLTTNIQGKEHVRVEGWTLCGSMLGVFPVVEWTRPVENGWEARVEVRTLSGAVVGAAEAQCLRTESRWKGRDDYALRSMAQTRGMSKALRGPLGFVISLAGFDPSPEEEQHGSTRAFDPAKDLLEGAIWSSKKEDVISRQQEALAAIDPSIDWKQTLGQLTDERNTDFLRRLSNAIERIIASSGGGDLVEEKVIVEAFAWAFSGQMLSIEIKEVGDAALTKEQQAAVDASADDQIPFGDPDE